jgi:hypothetical protein
MGQNGNIGGAQGHICRIDPQLCYEQSEDDADVVHTEVFRRA